MSNLNPFDGDDRDFVDASAWQQRQHSDLMDEALEARAGDSVQDDSTSIDSSDAVLAEFVVVVAVAVETAIDAYDDVGVRVDDDDDVPYHSFPVRDR